MHLHKAEPPYRDECTLLAIALQPSERSCCGDARVPDGRPRAGKNVHLGSFAEVVALTTDVRCEQGVEAAAGR